MEKDFDWLILIGVFFVLVGLIGLMTQCAGCSAPPIAPSVIAYDDTADQLADMIRSNQPTPSGYLGQGAYTPPTHNAEPIHPFAGWFRRPDAVAHAVYHGGATAPKTGGGR